ncbi:MAG: PAS domain S-box protein [Spirochaetes bacterium]|nr:PAS domain S-box protein [Spirochaetota bacterium]
MTGRDWGIDLTGRRMRYAPWATTDDGRYRAPSEKERERTYGVSAAAAAESVGYFEACGGSVPALAELLHGHLCDPRFSVTPGELRDPSRWYTHEYYFYVQMFCKKLLGRYDWHFGEGSDAPLSEWHQPYEKGFLVDTPFGGLTSGVKNFVPFAFAKAYAATGLDLRDYFAWLDLLGARKTGITFSSQLSGVQHIWLSLEFVSISYEFARIISNEHSWVELAKKGSSSLRLMQFSFVPRSMLLKAFAYIFNTTTNVYHTEMSLRGETVHAHFRFRDSEVGRYGIYRLGCLKTAYEVTIGGLSYIYKAVAGLEDFPEVAVRGSLLEPELRLEFQSARRIDPWTPLIHSLLMLALGGGLFSLWFHGFLAAGAAVALAATGTLLLTFMVHTRNQRKRIRTLEAKILEIRALSEENIRDLEGLSDSLLREKRSLEKSEGDLRRERGIFRTLVNHAKDLFMLYDGAGNLIHLSPRCEEVTGLTRAQMETQGIHAFIHPDDRSRVRLEWERILRDGTPVVECEYRLVDRHGIVTRVLSHSAERIQLEDDSFGVQNVLVDITARKREQEALLESRLGERSSLLVSHVLYDLVNKNHAYQNLIDIAIGRLGKPGLADREIEEISRTLGFALESGRQLEAVVLQLRTFTDYGQPVKVRANLAASLSAIAAAVGPAQGLAVHAEYSEDLPVVEIDPKQFSRAIENLLREARDAYASDCAPRPVWLTAAPRRLAKGNPEDLPPGTYASLWVRDAGRTRSEAELADAWSIKVSGTGEDRDLRLFVVRSIVRKHGGSVRLEAREGGGTSFEILLPAATGA